MADDISKLAQIFNNGFNSLGRQITLLTQAINMQKPTPPAAVQVKLPDNFKVNVPDINIPIFKIPDVKIDTRGMESAIKDGLGSQKAPVVNVPAPIVNVSPSTMDFPEEMEIKGIQELNDKLAELLGQKNPITDINSRKPMAVMVVDKKGDQITNFGGEFSAPNVVGLRIGSTILSSSHPLPVTQGFQIPVYDTEVIDATNAPATTTITYKLAGVTVKTKTISVSGNITTISVA